MNPRNRDERTERPYATARVLLSLFASLLLVTGCDNSTAEAAYRSDTPGGPIPAVFANRLPWSYRTGPSPLPNRSSFETWSTAAAITHCMP